MKFLPIIFLISLLILFHGCASQHEYSPFYAKELADDGRTDEAIAVYKLHIQRRLAEEDRPSDENPYFFYLAIGDIYLKKNDLLNARIAYETALANEVSHLSLADRFKQLADALGNQNKHDEAIELLKKYQHLDPLMLPLAIDTLHRQMIAKEDMQR